MPFEMGRGMEEGMESTTPSIASFVFFQIPYFINPEQLRRKEDTF